MLRFILFLSLSFCVWGQTRKPVVAVKAPALDKTKLEAYLRHQFSLGPDYQVRIEDPQPSSVEGLFELHITVQNAKTTQQVTFYTSRDGRQLVEGKIHDLTRHPFQWELDRLRTANQPAFGTPGAPVVLVVFSDFQCPYCAEEAKMLRDNLVANYPTQVRLYFKELPLEAIHDWARPAAVAGRCIYKLQGDKFWDFHDWVFAQQKTLSKATFNDKLFEFAAQKQIDVLQLRQCIESKAADPDIEQNIAEARTLQVQATPTLFVNGRRLDNVQWPVLKQVIDREIEYQKTAKNAGDQGCCEVKLPIPVRD